MQSSRALPEAKLIEDFINGKFAALKTKWQDNKPDGTRGKALSKADTSLNDFLNKIKTADVNTKDIDKSYQIIKNDIKALQKIIKDNKDNKFATSGDDSVTVWDQAFSTFLNTVYSQMNVGLQREQSVSRIYNSPSPKGSKTSSSPASVANQSIYQTPNTTIPSIQNLNTPINNDELTQLTHSKDKVNPAFEQRLANLEVSIDRILKLEEQINTLEKTYLKRPLEDKSSKIDLFEESFKSFNKKIEQLQNQVNSLSQKSVDLEARNKNINLNEEKVLILLKTLNDRMDSLSTIETLEGGKNNLLNKVSESKASNDIIDQINDATAQTNNTSMPLTLKKSSSFKVIDSNSKQPANHIPPGEPEKKSKASKRNRWLALGVVVLATIVATLYSAGSAIASAIALPTSLASIAVTIGLFSIPLYGQILLGAAALAGIAYLSYSAVEAYRAHKLEQRNLLTTKMENIITTNIDEDRQKILNNIDNSLVNINGAKKNSNSYKSINQTLQANASTGLINENSVNNIESTIVIVDDENIIDDPLNEREDSVSEAELPSFHQETVPPSGKQIISTIQTKFMPKKGSMNQVDSTYITHEDGHPVNGQTVRPN